MSVLQWGYVLKWGYVLNHGYVLNSGCTLHVGMSECGYVLKRGYVSAAIDFFLSPSPSWAWWGWRLPRCLGMEKLFQGSNLLLLTPRDWRAAVSTAGLRVCGVSSKFPLSNGKVVCDNPARCRVKQLSRSFFRCVSVEQHATFCAIGGRDQLGSEWVFSTLLCYAALRLGERGLMLSQWGGEASNLPFKSLCTRRTCIWKSEFSSHKTGRAVAIL